LYIFDCNLIVIVILSLKCQISMRDYNLFQIGKITTWRN